MSTIALGIIFKNVAENIWGRDDLKFPSPLPEAPIKLLGANICRWKFWSWSAPC
jgi:branched-chain amino acid transport system permease protein